jgi:hypothetical protein
VTKVLRGVIHGKTIELDDSTGLEDGRQVEVIVRACELPGPPPGWKPGGTDTAAGMLADCWTTADDHILEEIHRERKKDHRSELPE